MISYTIYTAFITCYKPKILNCGEAKWKSKDPLLITESCDSQILIQTDFAISIFSFIGCSSVWCFSCLKGLFPLTATILCTAGGITIFPLTSCLFFRICSGSCFWSEYTFIRYYTISKHSENWWNILFSPIPPRLLCLFYFPIANSWGLRNLKEIIFWRSLWQHFINSTPIQMCALLCTWLDLWQFSHRLWT